MAYSRSESTLKAMLPDLEDIRHGRTQKWDCAPGRAQWKASKIREALYIARTLFPTKYPELAAVARTFTIEVLDDHTVQARPSGNTPATALGDGEGLGPSESPGPPATTPIHGLEPAGVVPRTIVGQTSATGIISWVLQALPTNDKLVFTEVWLPDPELDSLAKWAASRTPRWMVVVSKSAGIVTLAPWQPGVPAWTPRVAI